MADPNVKFIVKYVSADIIRELFNGSQIPSQIDTGQLKPKVLRDYELKNPDTRNFPEPIGTRSQIIRYSDSNGNWVVVVHQYMRPDGRIGATGKPDPKRLRVGNTIYIVQHG